MGARLSKKRDNIDAFWKKLDHIFPELTTFCFRKGLRQSDLIELKRLFEQYPDKSEALLEFLNNRLESMKSEM